MWTDSGNGITWREVKFLDPSKTNKSEGSFRICSIQSRTKVEGVKMIRYRRNLDRKLFHLGALLRGSEMASSWIAAPVPNRLGCGYNSTTRPIRNVKISGSGGSMVARLKLKGIDGKAPPGVELAA